MKKYNTLVIGSGGREHSLIWKIKQSQFLNEIYSIPGNGGILEDAVVLDTEFTFENVKKAIEEFNIDIVIVGPEEPLVKGITDYLKDKNIIVFGPSKKAALLEGSKVFAKNFMKKYSIPTADFEVFKDKNKAIDYLKTKKEAVIKADGLCAGKGVFVCNSFKESHNAVLKLMEDKIFGNAGDEIIIEEKLEGEETSILVFLNSDVYIPLIPARDYKRRFEGNKGPNTGGMGSYAPTNLINAKIMERIDNNIIKKVIKGLTDEGIIYKGILYIGLMIVKENPFVLEFNIRFGDPETQCILPLLEDDLLEVILNLEEKKNISLKWKKGVCVDVVLASNGYPGKYEKGKLINLKIDQEMNQDIFIFHAGTKFEKGKYYTNGGRVLNIASIGRDIKEARKKVYGFIENNVYFDGMQFRKDIGLKEES